MARSKSSNRWLEEHVNDPYVKKAQVDGYRARAAYKLIELNEKDKLIRPGMMVVDLGSAPGSWSQIAGRLVGVKGRVVASDILPMDSLEHVDFIQGDFTEEAVFNQIMEKLGGNRADDQHFPVPVRLIDHAANRVRQDLRFSRQPAARCATRPRRRVLSDRTKPCGASVARS